MSVVVDMRREDDTNGIMATLLRDSAGKSIDESETSAGKILKEAVTSKERKVNVSEHQFYKNPHYVPLDEIDRMGDRLAAEYIIHTDTWTDTNMEYLLGIADRCADAAKSHDIEQKHFKGKHTTLTIPSMFLAASASLTAGFGATRANSSLSIASAVLAAASGFMQSVINYHEWNIRSNKHGSAAVRFGGLTEHIRALRHLTEERRRSYEVESVYVLMTLAGIMHEEPPLPDGGRGPWYKRCCILW
jgi:hypothetical protein